MAILNREFFSFDEFELHPSARALLRKGEKVALAPKSFEVLVCLVANAGRLVTKEELLNAVWPGAFVEESNLTQHIFWLRKAMPGTDFIATMPGRGYQFTAPVRVITEQEQEAGPDYSLQRVTEQTKVVYEETVYERTDGQPNRAKRSGLLLAASLFGVVLVAAGWLVWLRVRQRPTGIYRRMVIAEIVNSTGDPEFDRILTHDYAVYLSQSPYMSPQSEAALATAGSPSPLTSKELCAKSKRPLWLNGSIVRKGSGYLLTLEANECATGKKIASVHSVAEGKQQVFKAVDATADKLRAKLGEPSWSLEKYHVSVEQMDTASLDAARANDQGNVMLFSKDMAASLPYFQKAIELDPGYAMAYGQIANVHQALGELDAAAQFYRRAFELSSRLSERDKLVLRAHYYADSEHDYLQAIPTYEQWAVEFPFEAGPPVNLSAIYYRLGQPEPGIVYAKKALALRPDAVLPYANLVVLDIMAGHLDEVKFIAEQAKQHNADSAILHLNMYTLALLQHDKAAIEREVQWAAQSDDTWYRWDFVDAEGKAAATAGKLAEAEKLFEKAHEIALKENLLEPAAGTVMDEATMQLLFGYPEKAKATLLRVNKADATQSQLTTLQAYMGDSSAVKDYLQKESQSYRVDTIFNFVTMPELKAELAMRAGHPLEAIALLEVTRPYDHVDYQSMTERAEAYAQAGQNQMAITEYRNVLANPGIDPAWPLYPLAHLGLARAAAAAGDVSLSRVEYEAFLLAWKDADADLPILKQAKAEYTKLPSTTR
jgi:DNA-binding winged helix-turn-helix (wHTH) protein/tetratricopeptide (TPR) repeat protein